MVEQAVVSGRVCLCVSGLYLSVCLFVTSALEKTSTDL